MLQEPGSGINRRERPDIKIGSKREWQRLRQTRKGMFPLRRAAAAQLNQLLPIANVQPTLPVLLIFHKKPEIYIFT